MGLLVVMGAALKCSQGLAPGSLLVVRPTIMAGGKPAANVLDFAPMTNIPPFGMCNSKQNPAVVAATSAAQGVHTPAPCVPVTQKWSPGCKKVKIQGQAALEDGSTCKCQWNGTITVENAGQTKVKGS